ncbi:MAG: DUF72 domain-containing protein [Thermoprotei archaeon]
MAEFRSPEWWRHTHEVAETGAAFCSVDAPGLPANTVCTNNTLYMRLHGRGEWYSYVYTQEELNQIVDTIKKSEAKLVGVYLNNDTGMLQNARYLARRLTQTRNE